MAPRIRRLSVALALIVMLVLVAAVGPGVHRTASTLASSGSISGTVKDKGGTPIAGATVTARLMQGSGSAGSTTTAANGTYTVFALDNNTYSVQATRAGYASEFYPDSYTSESPVTVSGGAATTGINIALGPGGSVSGTVRNAASAPIAGATVAVFDFCVCGGQTTTAADGTYTIADLPPTPKSVTASAPGFPTLYYNGTYDFSLATPITPVIGTPTTGIDFTLQAAATISGTVTASGDGAIANANVQPRLNTPGCCVGGNSFSLANGSYSLTGLPPGCYTVFASASGRAGAYYGGVYEPGASTPVCVAAGATATGVNFVLGPASHISGTVTDTHGAPVAGANVNASPGFCCSGSQFATTAANGTYVINDLAPIAYTVGISATGYITQCYNGHPACSSEDLVTPPAAGTAANINFTLSAVGGISGKITDQNGAPVAGATVLAETTPCCLAQNTATTAGDGTYLISDVGPGTYTVRIQHAAGFAPRYYGNVYDQSLATVITVASGATTPGIDISLEPGATISGKVRDGTNAPVFGASVVAYPLGSTPLEFAATAADGSYTTPDLAPGVYIMVVSAPGFAPQYYPGVSDISAATRLTAVNGGTTPNIDFTLLVGGSIRGRVTDTLGNPLSGAFVDVSPGVFFSSSFAQTDSNGDFTVSHIPPGSYTVHFQASGFASEFYHNAAPASAAQKLTLVDGQAITGVNEDLSHPTGSISGTVRDQNGQPIAGATVCADSPFIFCSPSATTNAQGAYTLTQLGALSHVVVAYAPGKAAQYYNHQSSLPAPDVAVTEGVNTPNIDFNLTAEGSVGGTVRDAAGHPLSARLVGALQSGQVVSVAQTAADGTYAIGQLGTGDYQILEVQGTYYNGVTDPALATPVHVVGGSPTTGIDFNLGQDPDADGVVAASDNCSSAFNPEQTNTDGDAMGDACDPDDDNDGLLDTVETDTGVFINTSNTGTDPLIADTDADGCGDGKELGANPGAGGLRSPLNHWDFFDAGTSRGAAGPGDENFAKDKKINFADALIVFDHFAHDGADAADHQLDRDITDLAKPWLTSEGLPGDKVTLQDVLNSLHSFGDTCA